MIYIIYFQQVWPSLRSGKLDLVYEASALVRHMSIAFCHIHSIKQGDLVSVEKD
jgi:hypothetical protein